MMEQRYNQFADGDLANELASVTGAANRVNAAIYTLDPRGVVGTTNVEANVDITELRTHIGKTQSSLRVLAESTGGFAVVNSNDLAMGFQRIMADQRGYYLIGYQPEAGTLSFKSDQQFRRVKIKVKPKGLKIRTRSGFYGQATE